MSLVKRAVLNGLIAGLITWILLVAIAFLAGCKKDESPPHIAPPVAKGRCVVFEYRDDVEAVQDCIYGGYTYHCAEDVNAIVRCKLVGEAAGERRPEPAK